MTISALLRLALATLALSAVTSSELDTAVALTGSVDEVGTLLIHDAALAYSLAEPEVTISLTPNLDDMSAAFTQVASGALDFSVYSVKPLAPLLDALGLNSFPIACTAVVPVYRMDSLGSYSPAVILSPPLLAQIFLGNLTTWNDPRIVAVNPLITLPALNITVVLHRDANVVSEAASLSMASASAAFRSEVIPSPLPAWPIANYTKYVSCMGMECVTATVSTINGAIGFATQPMALDKTVSIANLINAAGNAVTPSISSVLFGEVEIAIKRLQNTNESVTVDYSNANWTSTALVNPQGSDAWPIITASWLTVKKVIDDPTQCQKRAALASWIMFLYESSQIALIQNSRSYTYVADIVLSMRNTFPDIQQGLLCANSSSYTLASELGLAATQRQYLELTMAANDRFSLLFELLLEYWTAEEQDRGLELHWSFQGQLSSTQAFDAVINGDSGSALILLDELSASQRAQISSLRSEKKYLFFPLFVTGIVPIYSTQLTSNYTLPPSLSVNVSTFMSMFAYHITNWNDPVLVASNPTLTGVPSVPTRCVTRCDVTDTGSLVHGFLVQAAPYDATAAYILTSPVPCNSSLFNSAALINSAGPMGYFASPTEASQLSLVRAVSGSFSYSVYSPSLSVLNDNVGIFDLQFPGRPTALTASPETFLACFDMFNSADLTVDFLQSTAANCYTFSRPVYVMVPAQFIDINNDQCDYARQQLEMLSWLVENEALSQAFQLEGYARSSDLVNVRDAILTAINSIECVNPGTGESDTIMVSLPIQWSMSSVITIAGTVIAGIGLMTVIASLLVIAIYRHHPNIVSSSPLFLALTVLGVGVVLVACIFLSLPATVTTCSLLSWSLHLGLMLTLAPLFVKTYRVYRIFGGKKLSVVKISNRKLLLMIATAAMMEIVLLAVAQGVAPLQPIQMSRISGSPPRIHLYEICSVPSGAGTAIFAVEAGLKGALLLFGGLMGFSTRRVSESFNESSNIAWSIYNILLSVGLVSVITALVDATGDTLIWLLLFALLWIALTTLILNIGPRLLSLMAPIHEMNPDDSGARVSSHGFSLLSMAAFATPSSMAQYLMALETQLAQSQARYSMLKSGDRRGKDWLKAGQHPQGKANISAKDSASVDKPQTSHSSPILKAQNQSDANCTTTGNEKQLHPSIRSPPSANRTVPVTGNAVNGNGSGSSSYSATSPAVITTGTPVAVAKSSPSNRGSGRPVQASSRAIPQHTVTVLTAHNSATSTNGSQLTATTPSGSAAVPPVERPRPASASVSRSSKSTAKVTPIVLSAAAVVQAATLPSASSKSNNAWTGDTHRGSVAATDSQRNSIVEEALAVMGGNSMSVGERGEPKPAGSEGESATKRALNAETESAVPAVATPDECAPGAVSGTPPGAVHSDESDTHLEEELAKLTVNAA